MFSDIKNTATPDTFRVVVPADLEKSKDGEWRIRGLASTERADQQGETIIQKGIDLTPIDKKKGIINFDHMKGPENTIGFLDGYAHTPRGLQIEGRLFKNHTKAKAVREIMESLSEGDRGRVGLSVEGRIIQRDPSNPAIILKCQISAVAITLNPVNTDTFADIVKSMNAADSVEINAEEEASQVSNEAVFTASQVMAIVQKALSIGAGATGAPDYKTGGDALQPSDMTSKKKKKELEKGEEDTDGDVEKGGPGSGMKGHKTIKDKHGDQSHEGPRMPKEMQQALDRASENMSEKEHEKKFGKPKRKMKKMEKSLYKSNLIGILDKLQVLYPTHSRSEIWEAVKDRLDTKFEKGGPGSGIKGHRSSKKNYDRFKWDAKGNYKGSEYVTGKHPDTGKPTVGVWNKEKDDYVFHHEVESHPELNKAGMLRIHNTSGKEREHKLYEHARQRDDYENNKDKSKQELIQIAKESGLPNKEKEAIRAQKDAAVQVGDRDHVRPNVKG